MTDIHGPSDSKSLEVAELHGTEGGRWKVHTQGSVHLFDLDRQTVTRLPGANSRATMNDVTRNLRSIEACAVGRGGYWTMEARSFEIAFFWHLSTRIERITRVPDEPEEHR
ncbi:MAG: hypothetical protein ABWY23_05935 [Mycetocola sp.]